MNRLDSSIYHLARLVLQTETPLSIGAGGNDSLYDNLIVRDANGLPAIPGSSLAGVLRALYLEIYGKTDTDDLFGTADRNQESPSRIQVSWGYLHDQNDKPIEELREPNTVAASNDELIQDALPPEPLRRDHVKLNHRGVSDAEKQGKFDRTSLTAGHRFSVELSLWSESENDPAWRRLLDLLHHPLFRLGGNTRRGLGKIKLARCAVGFFKLGKSDTEGKELARFSQLSQSLADTPALIKQKLLKALEKTAETAPLNYIELRLKPIAEGFRFGGGDTAWEYQESDLKPLIEKRVVWENGKPARIEKKALLFSASSFKGALSHRIAYHCNLLNGVFADDKNQESLKQVIENNAAVRELFGYV